jgi:Na+:H+ antiporter, NhaA family
LSKPLLLWINEGLMAIFLFLVGLELKREAIEGNLSSYAQAILPGLGAAAGMAAPAAIYYVIIGGDPLLARGWAVCMQILHQSPGFLPCKTFPIFQLNISRRW